MVEWFTMPPCHGVRCGFESRWSRQKIRVSYNGIIQAFGSCDLGSTPNTLTNILRYGVMEAHVVLVHTVQVRALVSQQLTRNDPQREVTCFGCRVIAGSSPVYATKKWM